MHGQHNGASCGKRQLLRNDRGRYLPWSFNKRSKRKGKPPCRKGRESKKNNNKNHGIFRCLCLHHPWPLLHKSQGSVIAQTSCKVRCLYGGMFIAGVVFFLRKLWNDPRRVFFPCVCAWLKSDSPAQDCWSHSRLASTPGSQQDQSFLSL